MSICLSMIVKNESPVIVRCLESVIDSIDQWIIVDTGSTDDTISKIMEFMNRHRSIKPGKLVERPWIDFATNRNEALALAFERSDYALFIDADDTLVGKISHGEGRTIECVRSSWQDPIESHVCEALRADVQFGNLVWARDILVHKSTNPQWRGVIHESICYNHEPERAFSHVVSIRCGTDGARRRDPNSGKHDLEVLRREFKENFSPRTAFYLAQTERDQGLYDHAVESYLACQQTSLWIEEKTYCSYGMGMCRYAQGDFRSARGFFLEGFNANPVRAEGLYMAARCSRMLKEYALADVYASAAHFMKKPAESLFCEFDVYEWKILDELALAKYYSGDLMQAKFYSDWIVDMKKYPQSEASRIAANHEWYSGKKGGTGQCP